MCTSKIIFSSFWGRSAENGSGSGSGGSGKA